MKRQICSGASLPVAVLGRAVSDPPHEAFSFVARPQALLEFLMPARKAPDVLMAVAPNVALVQVATPGVRAAVTPIGVGLGHRALPSFLRGGVLSLRFTPVDYACPARAASRCALPTAVMTG